MSENPSARRLRHALVGEHVDLYLNSAFFHQTIDKLALLLPELVDAYAVLAEAKTRDFEERLGVARGEIRS